MAVRRLTGSSFSGAPSLMAGMGGKSLASMPATLASLRAQTMRSWRPRGVSVISMGSLGSELTKSDRRRAGTVMAPSSSTLAPIQEVMAISRLVAASLSRPDSEAMRTWEVWGNVLRTATARPTIDRPLERFSCRLEIFMATTYK